MAIEKVREYFKQFNIEDKIQEFNVSSATVELASKALNCEPARIAKSLSFIVLDKPLIIVVAGNIKISNSKFKHQFKTKAKMIPFENTEKLTLMLHLKQKRAMIRKTYNWFADYHVGKTRSLAVDLFCRLFVLTCEIETSGFDLRNLPQNELIVLSQLVENIEKILVMLGKDNVEEKTLKMISLSMEGMFLSYDEIRENLQKYLK